VRPDGRSRMRADPLTKVLSVPEAG
jgi:hypothetical protein